MLERLLGRVLELLRQHWQSLIGVALVAGAISALIQLVYGLAIGDAVEEAETVEDLSSVVWISLLGLGIGLVVTLVIDSVLVVIIRDADRGGQPEPGRALEAAVSRLGVLVAVSLLGGLAVFVGLLFLFAPGIWVAVSLVPLIAVVMFEDRGVFDSMRRSFALVRGSWWPVFGLMIVLVFVNLILSFLTTFPGPLGFLMAVIVSAITLTVYAVAMYVAYDELSTDELGAR